LPRTGHRVALGSCEKWQLAVGFHSKGKWLWKVRDYYITENDSSLKSGVILQCCTEFNSAAWWTIM